MSVSIKDWQKILKQDNIKMAEPLKAHTTFKIGGLADWFLTPTSITQLAKIVALCKEKQVNYFVLGAGSNCLAKDTGFAGVVISTEKLKTVKVEDNVVVAYAGARLSKIVSTCLEKKLSGFEFAVGIPASCGGAVFMNAGAFGHQIADIVEDVFVLSDGKIKKLKASECGFSYRLSRFKESKEIIVKATFKLKPAPASLILEKMQDYFSRRSKTQPFCASAGSVFKKTENFPAGFLIEQAGLKGLSIGDAKVSTKHANFIVNACNATASQVLQLIDIIKNEVYLQFGIKLELEIILIGEKDENTRGLSYSQHIQQV